MATIPTTSAGVTDAAVFNAEDPVGVGEPDEPPHIVFLTNKDPYNYEAHRTVPTFAERLREKRGYRVTVLMAEGQLPAVSFPNLDALEEADLLVIFFRRAALPVDQLETIKEYLARGPLVGVRTANHAFSVRDADKKEIPEGYSAWWDFVPDILGCKNRGYGPQEEGVDVEVVQEESDHPILENVKPTEWHSDGVLYHVAPLVDQDATVLLRGSIENAVEPLAWTRYQNDNRVFYTSLGYPDDFNHPPFRQLLINGIQWALDSTE